MVSRDRHATRGTIFGILMRSRTAILTTLLLAVGGLAQAGQDEVPPEAGSSIG